MITYVKRKHIKYKTDANGKERSVELVELRGLGTDEKPTEFIANGSIFIDIGTKEVSMFDEDSGKWR